MALSVQTPKHLKEIGLLDQATQIDDYETSINFLMAIALKKVASLPFAYIIDKYRWAIFDGSVDPSQYNSYWWKLRCYIMNFLNYYLTVILYNPTNQSGRNIKALSLPLNDRKRISIRELYTMSLLTSTTAGENKNDSEINLKLSGCG